MKATRSRTPSVQRVFAGRVGVGGLPDAHRERVESLAAEGFCQPLPAEGSYLLCRRVDFLQAGDIVQVPIMHGTGQRLYSPAEFPDIVERTVIFQMLAAHYHLHPVGVSVRPGGGPEIPDEPVRGLEPRGDVDLIHPDLLG